MTSTARPARLDRRSPYVLDVHELGRRPGAMRAVTRTVPAPADLGSEIIGIAEGTDVVLDLSLESVMDGVYLHGTALAHATGECVRCLDPLALDLEAEVQELYLYDPPEDEGDDDGLEPLPLVTDELIDLEPTVRDTLVPALPFQPVCSPDCLGLCSRCGVRLSEDPGHSHVDIDPRWAALGALAQPAPEPAPGSVPGSAPPPAARHHEES